MRKSIIISLVVLLSGGQSAFAGKIISDTIKSAILGSEIKFNVYLPSGFGETDKLYPSVYLLHGLSDDQDAWRDKGRMQLVADELMASGESAEMVIFMPAAGDADTHNTPCGYFNVPGWSYEDFFFNEFIPEVERRYNCYGDKGHRAVMGLSMGGGGSTVYCQRHPDMFSSCYAMSPWLTNKNNEVGGSDPQKKDRLYYTCESVTANDTIEYLRKADKKTIDDLKTVKWFFDCGDDDYLLALSFEMHLQMRESGIHDEFRVHNGVHNWEYWHLALRDALPFASRNFD